MSYPPNTPLGQGIVSPPQQALQDIAGPTETRAVSPLTPKLMVSLVTPLWRSQVEFRCPRQSDRSGVEESELGILWAKRDKGRPYLPSPSAGGGSRGGLCFLSWTKMTPKVELL